MVLIEDFSSRRTRSSLDLEKEIISTSGCSNCPRCQSWSSWTLPAWLNLFAPTKSSSTRDTGNLSDETHRINELPEDILSHIFSFLAVKEVAVASMVSRRWNQLCKSIRELDFNWFTMFETRPFDEFLKDGRCQCRRRPRLQDRFIRGVNQNLRFNNSSDLWYLRISFCFGEEHTLTVDMWVRLAVVLGVRKFFLHLSCGNAPKPARHYVLHPWLFSERGGIEPKFTFLSLRSCKLVNGLFEKLRSLKELILTKISVGESNFKSILSCCLKLEMLWLYSCFLPRKLCIISESPDSPLKIFKMHHCTKVQEIEVSAINLTEFYYCGGRVDISFDQVPNLEIMYIKSLDPTWRSLFKTSFRYFHPVKKLSVFASTTNWVYNVPSAATSFRRLTQLTLFSPDVEDLNILKLKYILRVCQNLETLRIVTNGFEGPASMPFECVNKSLKKVELGGFYGILEQIEFVIYLLESAVALEEMVIDPRTEVFDGVECTFMGTNVPSWDEGEPEKIRILLQGFLRAATLRIVT